MAGNSRHYRARSAGRRAARWTREAEVARKAYTQGWPKVAQPISVREQTPLYLCQRENSLLLHLFGSCTSIFAPPSLLLYCFRMIVMPVVRAMPDTRHLAPTWPSNRSSFAPGLTMYIDGVILRRGRFKRLKTEFSMSLREKL